MNDAIVGGVDIGGSHITTALIDIRTGKIIENTLRRREVNPGQKADDIIHLWATTIAESFDALNLKSRIVGVAMPGPFDYENGISYIKGQNKYDALYGLNVKAKLAEKLGIGPDDISFTNDAACFLQGEVFGGVGEGFERVIGLTLGTGLGSAKLVGRAAFDANLWCSEFEDGIAEDYLSTKWFVKRYRDISGQDIKGVKELVDKVRETPLVEEIFNEFGKNLGNFLTPYIKAEACQLVVLGGNISLAFPYFSEALKKAIKQQPHPVEIRTAKLGEGAALIGAACSYHFFALNAGRLGKRDVLLSKGE